MSDERDKVPVRPEDVFCFMKIFDRATKGPGAGRHTSFSMLVGEGGPDRKEKYTTILSQLRRIADFADTIDPPGSKRPGERPRTQDLRRGLDVLFEHSHDGGLVPTAVAKALHQVFQGLVETYDNLEELAGRILKLREPKPIVRGGAPPNFSYHLCPYILSEWQEKKVFGELLRLATAATVGAHLA